MTRREREERARRSLAAKKAWKKRRARERAEQKRRSLAAKKGWEKRRAKPVLVGRPSTEREKAAERRALAEHLKLFREQEQRRRRSEAGKKAWAVRQEKQRAKEEADALRVIAREEAKRERQALSEFRNRPQKADLHALARQSNTRRLRLTKLRIENGRIIGTDPTGRTWAAFRTREQTEPGETPPHTPIRWTRATTAEGFAKTRDAFWFGPLGELTSGALSQTPPGDQTYEEFDRDAYDLDFDNWEEA